VQHELPLTLVEKQAEGEVATEERREDGEGDGFNKPDGADDIRGSSLRYGLAWLGRRCGRGAGHRSFCVDCSTLRLAPVNRPCREVSLT
jgi:hypothetical protein